MRCSWNYFYRRFSCTRSSLNSRTVADALVFAALLSAIAAALGPAIFIQSPLNTTYASAAINLNYTYFNATYCKYELTNTTGAFNTSLPSCQNTTLSGITEGPNSVRVWGNDSANNWNSSNVVYFSVDTTPPSWVETPQNHTVEFNKSFAYYFNATDPSGVDRYRINDNANFTINSSTGLITNNTLLALGAYLINVSVNDTVGNANSALFTVNVLFDMTPPAIALIRPQFANYTTAAPNLSVTTSENSTITYNWDGAGNITGCRNCTAYNSTYGELLPEQGTLMLLHFNENYGNVSYDQAGRNNGTIYGASWSLGRFGYGIGFDGTNKNVTLPASLNIAGAFTIEVWVNATGTSNYMAIADKYEEVGSDANGYSIYLQNGMPRFGVYNSNNKWMAEWPPASQDIRNTGWHYIAGVYNGSLVRMFLDNVSYSNGPYFGGATASSLNLTLGNRANRSWYFNGTIDEVRLTSRALNDSELYANANRRLADGAHNLTVSATDNYGNVNSTNVTFSVDATLPFCTFLAANRTYFRNGTTLAFTAFCNDTANLVTSVYLNVSAIGGDIVQMSPGGGGNYTYSLTVNNNRSENVNASIYNITDAYGNTNYSNPVLALTVDNTNPGIWLNLSLNQSWQKGNISLNYTANDTQAISSCLWRWQNSTGIWGNYSQLACGTGMFQFNTTFCYDDPSYACKVELFANDSAGNSNSSQLYFKIDNNPPNLSQVAPSNNSVVYSNVTRISFNITDIASGVNVSTLTINDTLTLYNTSNISCSPIANGFNCSLSLAQADGPHSLILSAYDNRSNFAQTTVYYTVGGCQPPAAGNWDINYTQMCANTTLALNSNLTIQSNGNLTLRNVTLLMNGTYNGSRKIEVQGGALYILDNDGNQSTSDGSNITALDPANRFLFTAGENSTVEMINSGLSYAGYAGGGIIGVYMGAGESFKLGEGALFYKAKIRLTGNMFSNNFNGIVGQAENATIENNTIASNSGSGIQLWSVNSAIRQNKIVSNGQNGLFLFASNANLISGNNLSYNDRGLRLYASSNSTVLNNMVYSNSGSGITVEANSENNSLQYNTITSNNYGIHIQNSSGAKVGTNTFTGNSYGLRVSSTRNNLLSNNSISSTIFDGLYLDSANENNLSGNTILSSGRDGISLINSGNNAFLGNNVTGSGRAGSYFANSANNTFLGGDSFNGLYGAYFTGASNNTFISSAFSSTGEDLHLEGNSTSALLNASYSGPKTYFDNSNSRIFRQWYLRALTVNATGSMLNNTPITILDNQSTTVFSGQTGSDGAVRVALTESAVSTTTTTYTPHRINASINGYFGNASVTMDQNRNLTLTLYDITPPQVLDARFEPQYIYPDGTTAFRVYLWENAQVSSARFTVATPNGTYPYNLSFQYANSTLQVWSAQILNTSRPGQYNVTYLFINDTNGNNNTPSPSAYLRVQSDLPPNVTTVSASAQSVEVSSQITISANITDDYNMTAAYLSIFSPVSSQTGMSLLSGNSTYGRWQASYTPDQTGTYYYQIMATDSGSNTAYSPQYYFNSTPYNCTTRALPADCIAIGCLWTVGAAGACSFYNSSADKNTFELALNSDSTSLFLANKNTVARMTSTTARTEFFNISINSIISAFTLQIPANIPRDVGVMTNGIVLSPQNATILSISYENYKLSAVMNGTGNTSASVYTGTFGAPENITLDNVSVPISYDGVTKMASFNFALGSAHTLEVKFTQPCAPSGGACGTCCSGVCCLGVCTSTCPGAQQQGQSSPEIKVPVKRVSIYTSTDRIETRIGVPATFTITVKNTGSENLSAVTIDLANITMGWFKIAPLAYNMQVGAEGVFSLTVTPPLDGEYNFSVYVPNPRSSYVPMKLVVPNEYEIQAPTAEQPAGTPAAPEQASNLQELQARLDGLSGNISTAKKQGADTSSLEKTLEEARLALAEGDQNKAVLLIDYIYSELPKLKVKQASAASSIPTIFITLIALGFIGFVVARYRDRIFPPKADAGGESVTFNKEAGEAPTNTKTRISDLKSRVVQADMAMDEGNLQKAAEIYQAMQKDYTELVLSSAGSDAETIRALNEAYVGMERIYERLAKNG